MTIHWWFFTAALWATAYRGMVRGRGQLRAHPVSAHRPLNCSTLPLILLALGVFHAKQIH
jgi:hypothetical protein